MNHVAGHDQPGAALLAAAPLCAGHPQAAQAGDRGQCGHHESLVPGPRLSHGVSRVPRALHSPGHVPRVCDPVLQQLPVSLAPGPQLRGGGREAGQQRVHQALPGNIAISVVTN